MNSATDKSSLDRTLGAGKPVDPATRLSELLAQSLDELTRPFDPPRPGGPPRVADDAAHDQLAQEPTPEQTPEESRLDADKALAELEAELFAAAKQVERDPPAEASAEPAADHRRDAACRPAGRGSRKRVIRKSRRRAERVRHRSGRRS